LGLFYRAVPITHTICVSYRLKSQARRRYSVPTLPPFRGLVFLNKDVLDEITINGRLEHKVVRKDRKKRSFPFRSNTTLSGSSPSVDDIIERRMLRGPSIRVALASVASRLLWEQCAARPESSPTAIFRNFQYRRGKLAIDSGDQV